MGALRWAMRGRCGGDAEAKKLVVNQRLGAMGAMLSIFFKEKKGRRKKEELDEGRRAFFSTFLRPAKTYLTASEEA